MKLRDLIANLEKVPSGTVFPEGFGEPMSWRGSYAELAFAPAENVTADSMLQNARSALGATFEGYRGGEFTMDRFSECHIASYGSYGGDEDAFTLHRWRLMCLLAGLPDPTQTI